jgi:hypothetical protein
MFRIRIGSVFNQVSGSGSGSRRAKMTPKLEKVKKFPVLKCWMFSFEGFSCSLNVLYEGIGIHKLQYLIKEVFSKFLVVNFFNLW